MRDGFHWRDGWYFRRLTNGAVEVIKTVDPRSDDPEIRIEIPSEEWASIVCSVSAHGETGERWNAAQDFHGRVPSEVPA